MISSDWIREGVKEVPTPEKSTLAKRKMAVAIALAALLSLISAPAWARDPRDTACTSAQSCSGTFDLKEGGGILLHQSFPVAPSSPNPSIRRAVIVVHGNRRDADRYFDALVAATRLDNRLSDTLLIAPSFPTPKDAVPSHHHVWSSSGWKKGNRSKGLGRVSSFAAIDELLEAICPAGKSKFPMLRKVVIVGHSAGGQFVNRYAAGAAGCAHPGVEVRYVVMNPSSYLYLDGRRPVSARGARGEFKIPRFGCFEYNEYKYGLEDLNAYMEDVGEEQIRSNLKQRHIDYFAGEEDNNPRSSSLDKSCAAERQGDHRLRRFTNYRDYAALFADWTGSTFTTVPDVGHNARQMLASEHVRRVLFKDRVLRPSPPGNAPDSRHGAQPTDRKQPIRPDSSQRSASPSQAPPSPASH